jgi:hypothetical protein
MSDHVLRAEALEECWPSDGDRAFVETPWGSDNLKEAMAGLANFFECASHEFTHQDELASEMALSSM